MKKESSIIVQSSNKGISRIKLNDNSTYNALSLKTINSLIQAFDNFEKDEKTKVIIIEGTGKGFSAGHDLKEIKSLRGKEEYQELFDLCSRLMMKILSWLRPL